MSSSLSSAVPVVSRPIDSISEIREVQSLQREVWGWADLEIVPATQMLAAREVGGPLLGAFDGDLLVGFVYGFLGVERGRVLIHSDMLGVKAAYRNLGIGFRLKLAQRDLAIAQGITRITWTFDPLRSLNAHFNLAKLGGVADRYKVNFYGEGTSSFLHQGGTDRLWLTWLLDSGRVRDRLKRPGTPPEFNPLIQKLTPLVEVNTDGTPRRNSPAKVLAGEATTIEIPADVTVLQTQQRELMSDWREATRWAFLEAMGRGFLVTEFCRPTEQCPKGIYVLMLGRTIAGFAETP